MENLFVKGFLPMGEGGDTVRGLSVSLAPSEWGNDYLCITDGYNGDCVHKKKKKHVCMEQSCGKRFPSKKVGFFYGPDLFVLKGHPDVPDHYEAHRTLRKEMYSESVKSDFIDYRKYTTGKAVADGFKFSP